MLPVWFYALIMLSASVQFYAISSVQFCLCFLLSIVNVVMPFLSFPCIAMYCLLCFSTMPVFVYTVCVSWCNLCCSMLVLLFYTCVVPCYQYYLILPVLFTAAFVLLFRLFCSSIYALFFVPCVVQYC